MATQAKRDNYEVLGVARSASTEEIEQARGKLVTEIRHSGGETAMDRLLEVSRARAVLTDSIKRKHYDQFGHAAIDNPAPGFSGGFDPSNLPPDYARCAPDYEDWRDRGEEIAGWIETFLNIL